MLLAELKRQSRRKVAIIAPRDEREAPVLAKVVKLLSSAFRFGHVLSASRGAMTATMLRLCRSHQGVRLSENGVKLCWKKCGRR